jgi:hypothetical protein
LGSGETFYASCATAALEVPYVLGKIRGKFVTAEINTQCAHCERPINIEVGSDLTYRVKTEDSAPLVFEPRIVIDPKTFAEASIIDAY